jgi:hypothetical protein
MHRLRRCSSEASTLTVAKYVPTKYNDPNSFTMPRTLYGRHLRESLFEARVEFTIISNDEGPEPLAPQIDNHTVFPKPSRAV